MSPAVAQLKEVAAEWRRARRIYPLYAAMVKQFEFGCSPCADLECPIDRSEPEVLQRVHSWFDHMDGLTQAHHVRHVLQTTDLGDEPALSVLISRLLAKKEKTEADRDKLDFLLVQYFAHCAPASMNRIDLSQEDVASVLQPLLGAAGRAPGWLQPLEALLQQVQACTSMRDLLSQGLLYQARKIKIAAAELYFTPPALVAFTRFNFAARMAFFRLMRADLDAIRRHLQELERRGIYTVDCSRAKLGPQETLAGLREICNKWRTPFRAEYSSGHSFDQISEIRGALEEAVGSVAEPGEKPKLQAVPPSPPPPPPSKAALNLIDLCAKHIAAQLMSGPQPAKVASAITKVGEIELLLSSWEVKAFTVTPDDLGHAVRRAVSARGLLLDALQKRKRGDGVHLGAVLALAHAEAAVLQECVARAREEKNVDGAVNLAATAQRLLSLMREAETLKGPATASKGA